MPTFLKLSLPSICPTKCFYGFLIFPVRTTCAANLIQLDLITLMIYKLCSLLQPLVTSSPLGLTNIISVLFPDT